MVRVRNLDNLNGCQVKGSSCCQDGKCRGRGAACASIQGARQGSRAGRGRGGSAKGAECEQRDGHRVKLVIHGVQAHVTIKICNTTLPYSSPFLAS